MSTDKNDYLSRRAKKLADEQDLLIEHDEAYMKNPWSPENSEVNKCFNFFLN